MLRESFTTDFPDETNGVHMQTFLICCVLGVAGKKVLARFTACGSIFSHSFSRSFAFASGQTLVAAANSQHHQVQAAATGGDAGILDPANDFFVIHVLLERADRVVGGLGELIVGFLPVWQTCAVIPRISELRVVAFMPVTGAIRDWQLTARGLYFRPT